MANYFYVKSTGTLSATSDTPYSTRQTGAFPSDANCYATIVDALNKGKTTDPAGGDFVLVAHNHSHNYGGSVITYDGPGVGGWGSSPLFIMSVDASNCENYLAGAAELSTGSSASISYAGHLHVIGLSIKTDRNQTITVGPKTFTDCTLIIEEAGRQFSCSTAGAYANLHNSTVQWETASTTNYMTVSARSLLRMFGGTLDYSGTSSGVMLKNSDGGIAEFRGVDISSAEGYLVGTSDGATEAGIKVFIDRCKLNASLVGYDTISSNSATGQEITITNSSSSSAAAEYQYYFAARQGTAEDIDAIYRDNSTAFPSGVQISLKVATTTVAAIESPLVFNFPTRYAELSNTASDTLRIYLQSSTQLYDSDVWADVTYADGTNHHESNYLSTRHDNLLDTNGTELATNTESWSGTAQTYQYHIDISITDGADCYPTVRVYVAKASATIYFDSEIVVA